MKSLSVAKFKAEFSSVVAELKRGQEVAITYGRNKEPLGTIIPQSKLPKPDYAIQLGDLKAQGWNYRMDNFEMSNQELLGQ